MKGLKKGREKKRWKRFIARLGTGQKSAGGKCGMLKWGKLNDSSMVKDPKILTLPYVTGSNFSWSPFWWCLILVLQDMIPAPYIPLLPSLPLLLSDQSICRWITVVENKAEKDEKGGIQPMERTRKTNEEKKREHDCWRDKKEECKEKKKMVKTREDKTDR